MLKKSVLFMLLITIVFSFSTVYSSNSGNSKKGKYLYRKSCRTCHNPEGTAKSLSPDSKTQAQWKRQFKARNYKKLACKGEWEKLSEQKLTDIYSYLHKYAFDSPTPAKCK